MMWFWVWLVGIPVSALIAWRLHATRLPRMWP